MVNITETTWKNLTGILLENEQLRVIILPQLGGKIASLYYKTREFELAAQPGKETYSLPQLDDDFSLYDASGLDDAFPNIDAAVLEENGITWKYPDHGEIWSSRFDWKADGEQVLMKLQSERFPYTYEKTIHLDGQRVILQYRICNTGEIPFPCIWAFHGLVRYEEDMQFVYPPQTTSFENVLESPELGAVGEHFPIENTVYDFCRVPDKTTNTMVKYYVDQKVQRGFCAYNYPGQGVQCTIEYDSEKLPYLGVWITAGGYRGDYNCAIEPTNGYYDSVLTAKKQGKLYYLKRDEPLEFAIKIEMNNIVAG